MGILDVSIVDASPAQQKYQSTHFSCTNGGDCQLGTYPIKNSCRDLAVFGRNGARLECESLQLRQWGVRAARLPCPRFLCRFLVEKYVPMSSNSKESINCDLKSPQFFKRQTTSGSKSTKSSPRFSRNLQNYTIPPFLAKIESVATYFIH